VKAADSARARLLVAATALLFSTGGFVIKLTSQNAWQAAGLRAAVAGIALILFLPGVLRSWDWRYVPVAAAYAATTILFVLANKLTTAANAVFLQDTAPIFVLLLGPLLLNEPIRTSDIAFIAVVACGMALFFTAHEPIRATASNPLRGNLAAAASAVTWALTVMGLRWLARDRSTSSQGAMVTVVLGNMMACAVTLPFALPLTLTSRDVVAFLWLGVFQVALGYICLTRGMRVVPAFEASTILLLEPALNPIWTWMVHGEVPAAQSVAGGAIIVIATLVNSFRY
jgi:drug/metabolite transporter (DMT)-like permease